MAKLRFYPLDVTYKILNEKAVIHLFGKTTDDQQICVTDENFEPYFYVIPMGASNLQTVKDKLEKIRVEKEDYVALVTKTEIIKKKYFGKEVDAIKVFTKLPADVPVIRDVIKNWEFLESINEYDIRFARRYLIDKRIDPLTIVEAEGDFITQKARVPVFKATDIQQAGEDFLKQPKILAFDIETHNPEGKTMNMAKNPIIMLALYGENLQKVFTWKKFKTKEDFIEFVDSEAELIEKFKEIIDKYRPDIITGYFSDEFDLPYIKKRADKYKIKLDIGLDYSELKIVSKKSVTSKITGILHFDVFGYIRRIVASSLDTETLDLDSVASELLGERKIEVNLDELAHVWDSGSEEIEKFCSYNLRDSLLAYNICKKILPDALELAKMVGLPIYDIGRMGFSQLVESYLLKRAFEFNEIAPNRPSYDEIGRRRLQSYKGAFVFEPKPGLYKNIVVFDYRSLYPSIISSHNISPGTLNCDCCEEEAETAPTEDDKTYWFCKKKKGFIPTIIEDIITRRMRIKEIIDKKKEKNELLQARENSLKLLANSFYGYLGFFGARWYSIESARSVTAYGRYYIHKVIDEAKDAGFNVLYSDTDSVFLTLDKKTKEDSLKFAEKINLELPGLMELEYEGFYPSGIFVSAKEGPYGAKKKYALLPEDGNLKIRGFETVRRNWSFIAKEVQERVLDIILKEGNVEKALKYAKKIIDDLRNKKIPSEKVIIHTQLQKDISDYDSVGPHVKAAMRMKQKDIAVGPGSLIKFIVIKGAGSISDRARLPEELKGEEYDDEYYVNNQIIPSVERIFNVLGYKKEELLEKKDQEKLKKFF